MLDTQNLAATTSRSRKFICNSEPTDGQRKNDDGNTRRVALDRQLHREHVRDMRDAMSGDIENEDCTLCDRTASKCTCCKECKQFDCTCEDDTRHQNDHDVHASDEVNDDCCYDAAYFCNDYYYDDCYYDDDCHNEILASMFISSKKDSTMSKFFHGMIEIGTTERPKTRSSFITLCGGRLKKSKNRRGDCYNFSEYRRPVLRINGFNVPEVCEHFEDIAARKLEEQKAEKEAARLEAEAMKKQKAAKKRAAKKARRDQKRHQNVLDSYKHLTRLTLVSNVATGRKLPPGRVVKDASGKLVFQPYEEALAA
jgi:hypothetical protein